MSFANTPHAIHVQCYGHLVMLLQILIVWLQYNCNVRSRVSAIKHSYQYEVRDLGSDIKSTRFYAARR